MSRRKKGNDNTAVGILVLAVLMVIAIALGWYGLQIEEASKTTSATSTPTTTQSTSSTSTTPTATSPTNTTSQLFTVVNMTTTSAATNASTT